MSDNKTIRTATGQEIDMQTLMLQNETVRAVGNMNVNARGDVLDNKNKATSTRASQVNKNYRKQIGNVAKDEPIVSSQKAIANETITGLDEVVPEAPKPKTKAKKAKPKKVEAKVEEPVVEEAPVEEAPVEEVKSGLAGAIAKAREVKQEPYATPREKERGTTGVKKI